MATRPFEGKNKVAIVAVGPPKLIRDGARGVGALGVAACLKAIADAGLTVKDIDGLSNWPATDGQGVGPVEGWTSAHVDWMVQGLGIERGNGGSNGGGGTRSAAGA